MSDLVAKIDDCLGLSISVFVLVALAKYLVNFWQVVLLLLLLLIVDRCER